MLNTNPSNKRNAWKYSVILPALVGFFVMFQVKTIAQVKEAKFPKVVKEFQEINRVEFMIDKNTTDQQIKEETTQLKKDHDVTLKVSKVKRNNKKEITGLKINYKDDKGNKGSNQINGDEPIEPIVFYKETKNGNSTMGLTSLRFPKKMKRMVFHSKDEDDKDMVMDIDVDFDVDSDNEWFTDEDENVFFENVNGPKKKIFITNEGGNQEKKIIIIDDVEVSEIEMNELDPKVIEQVNVLKNSNGKNEIKIITKNTNGFPEDTEIYINGVKSTKADLEALEKEHIATIDINNFDDKKIIEIQKKVMKEVDEKMKKMNYKFEWKEDKPEKIIKIEKHRADMEERKVEMEKMKAELEKTKAELKKMKEELQKNK